MKLLRVFSFLILFAVAFQVSFGNNQQNRMLELSDFQPVINFLTAPFKWMYSLVEIVRSKFIGQIEESPSDSNNGNSGSNETSSEAFQPKPLSPHWPPSKVDSEDDPYSPVHHKPSSNTGSEYKPGHINTGVDSKNRPEEPVHPPHYRPVQPPANSKPFVPLYTMPEPKLEPNPHPTAPEMPSIDNNHGQRPHRPMPEVPPNWPFLPPSYWNQPIVLDDGSKVPKPPLMAMPEPNINNNNANEIPSWLPMPVPDNLPPQYKPDIPPDFPHHPPPPPPPPFGQHPPHVPLSNTIPKEFIVDDDKRCGKRTHDQNAVRNRIINGSVAIAHSWPWQIYLQVFHEDSVFSCGGSLIRVHKHIDESDIVLTAAHCITFNHNGYPIYRRAAQLRIWAGRHTLHLPYEDGQQVRSVVDLLMYPTFNPVSLRHDVALVKLDIPIKFNTTIQPVCRPVQYALIPAGKCFVTGWGRTESNNPRSTSLFLKELRLRVHVDKKCQLNDHGGWHKPPIPVVTYMVDENLCAGQLENPTESACQGDSGGPLVCYVGDKWVQNGIVSFGTGDCATSGKPTVFARVSFFADWVTSNAYNLTSVGKRHPLGTHHNGYQMPISRL